jgi:cysteine desulfuration protein SufE
MSEAMTAAAPDTTTLDEIVDNFSLLDEWDDRYRYVIELGRGLAPLSERDRTDGNKVQGCASQVWLQSFVSNGDGSTRLRFAGDSDALIVRGLIAIAFALFSGQTAERILAMDVSKELEKLQLADHLSPQRSNGFLSLIARVKQDAKTALSAEAQ